ncbi:MAG: hypothetical protein ACE5Z5_00200, partial [Candidatus Bathyarchaeia archaeon]
FLLVGDMVLKNDHSQMPRVVSAIRDVHAGSLVACFGNEEYEQSREEYKRIGEVTWLDDEATVIEVGGVTLGIVGSRGSLDRPTFWQRTHVKGIWQTYRRRVEVIDSLLAGMEAEVRVVMAHYAPTYRTLVGEMERAWPEMASKRLEGVIERRQPDVWLHGHAHRGRVGEAWFGRTLVVNTSLPARGEIVLLDLPMNPPQQKLCV